MDKLICVLLGFVASSTFAADYPNMEGTWSGTVRTVASGAQVRDQVAPGGALIQDIVLKLTVSYHEQEVFIGETTSSAPNSEPVSVWGAIRSNNKEGVFVTANGGRGNIWFITANQFEFCFANQTPEQMSAYCAVLDKQPQ